LNEKNTWFKIQGLEKKMKRTLGLKSKVLKEYLNEKKHLV
jgi:hypothetical protein